MLYRHGDIPIHKIGTLPEGKEIKHNGSFTFAEGEATGHNHTIYVEDPESMKILETAIGIVFEIKNHANVTHPEHGSFAEGINPGIYRFGKERERDPFMDATRKVDD